MSGVGAVIALGLHAFEDSGSALVENEILGLALMKERMMTSALSSGGF